MHTTQGIILAGVHQWRPSAFERWVPRTLVPVGNRPLVEYPLAWLRDSGIRSIEICANSDTVALQGHIGDGSALGIDVDYYEDKMPRGPAGCVADATADLDANTFVVVDATIIPRSVRLEDVIDSHNTSGAALTVVADGSKNRNKHRAILEPAGIYIFDRQVMDHVCPDGYQDIKEMLIPRLYASGEGVNTFVLDEPVARITGPDSCLAASSWLLGRAAEQDRTPEDYKWNGQALVHRTARVSHDARIVGPTLIGPQASVGQGATVIGPTTIGADCRIDDGALICRSILWNGAKVGAQAYLDRCILTFNSEIKRGTRHSNRIRYQAERRRRFFGRRSRRGQ